MYLETLTSIGDGSTGALGGTSDCWTCTMAGGGCVSIDVPLLRLAPYKACHLKPRRKMMKGDSLSSPPPHPCSVAVQKLNVMPVVAALIVAPPIVSLPASREQIW